MANESLKAVIRAAIKENQNQEITGEVLQQVLLAMVNALGAQYQFAGVATPATNPGTPDQNVFYFAYIAGTYTNFGAINVPGFSILKYNGSWSIDVIFEYDITTVFQTLPLLPSKYSIQTNYWLGESNRHIVIPVNGGETVEYSQTGTYAFYCAFLTSYETPVANVVPNFVDGYSGRQSYSTTFTIPAGTKFLIVNNPQSNGFTEIKINGINVLNGILPAVLSIITFVEQSIQSLQQLIGVVRDNNAYARCFTGPTVAEKAIATEQLPDFAFSKNARILIYFNNHNTADNVTLNIKNVSYPFYYRGQRASSTNSWSIGDVLDCRFDATENVWYAEPWSGIATLRDITGTITKNDFGYTVVSNNLADKRKITDALVASDGTVVPSQGGVWQMIEIPVVPGQVYTFGGFYLGRTGYAAFYNGNTKISYLQFPDPNGIEHPYTLTAPQNATTLYIDIKSGSSPSNPYQYLQVNKGATLLDYDDFEQKISSIDGDELIGGGGGTSEDLNTIIVDLPVSDGSDIQSGYAYIETSTRNVKVKA